jgi:hypothetical protein
MSKSSRQTRGAAKPSLKELLKVERLLADLSACFANVSGDQVELEIEFALNQLIQFLDFDRGSFGEFAANGWVTVICSVVREGVDPYPLGSRATFASWYLGQLRAEKIVRVRSIDDLPPRRRPEKSNTFAGPVSAPVWESRFGSAAKLSAFSTFPRFATRGDGRTTSSRD